MQTPSSRRGLDPAEAQARLAADGFNELPQAHQRTPLRIALEVLREPMLALLLAGGLIYLLLGSLAEAIILLIFAMLSTGITVVQESRSERVIEALRDLTSPRALVVRAGNRLRIPGREVVRGDLLVLSEGDRVPADAWLVEGMDIATDESLLTGESVPVRKVPAPAPAAAQAIRSGGDGLPVVFSGSLIVRGTGLAEVTATGARSEIGRIGKSLATMEIEPPRLQAQMRRLARTCGILGGGVSLLAVVLFGTLRGGWLDALLSGIALGMSMLPEELPMVLTIFMAMGAWRISQARVLTRRAAAIETLGSATILCTDKTGTLTENRMTVTALSDAEGTLVRLQAGPAPAGMQALIDTAVLASAPMPYDPMEIALHSLQQAQAATGPRREADLLHSWGLRPGLLAMSNAWAGDKPGDDIIVAAKGAPEAIATLCHLDATAQAGIARLVETMAGKGMRVLGVARTSLPGTTWPAHQTDMPYRFLGLIGFEDPLRAGVAAAAAECRSAGIKVAMITGDYPLTARVIAEQAGIEAREVITGDDLTAMDDTTLSARLDTVRVFARIMPEQKLRIVTALKARGEVVAMTGDGVNDAPSLKAAHIGIAMGGRGTDVAREAAALVLLDDDFGSIVKAAGLGRRIYDNLRKAMGFILAVHIPIAGLALLPLCFGLPILFGPVHIAFLEMVIDPVCSLVFEAETAEEGIMRRPPRDPDTPLFSASLVGWSVLQGSLALALVAGIYLLALWQAMPADEVRALTFFALVISLVALIFVNRSFSASLLVAFRRRNAALAWVLPIVVAMLAGALAVPFIRTLFRFGPLHLDDLAVALGAGVLTLAILELLKPLWRARLVR